MKRQHLQAGFSLIEVNMAVFVMAVGILSMVVLYPLGLRESTQGQADLKQAIFADDLLNQAVAAASLTNFPWRHPDAKTGWFDTFAGYGRGGANVPLPAFMTVRMHQPGKTAPLGNDDNLYRITCCLVPGYSDKLMGISVQSTELKNTSGYTQYSNNPIYYAEVMFQGDPLAK